MGIFQPATILIPQVDSMEKWAVVACDQYTSQPEYWNRVEAYAKGSASALNLILPEARMDETERLIPRINQTMNTYLESGIFQEYKNAYIYIERTLVNGSIRRGVIGAVDLNEYDYASDTDAAVRATERTVIERIPPRMNIRRNAPIELSHVLMLCDDKEHILLESLAEIKEECKKVYDFDLMEDGGHLIGWLIEGEHVTMFDERLAAYAEATRKEYPMIFAVGDGNHSLATAKACYEELKQKHPGEDLSDHPARYALVELGNIHDESQQFEPIHRIVTEVNTEAMLQAIKKDICAETGYELVLWVGEQKETVYLNPALGELPIGILQEFLDSYLKENQGEIDYIHGEDVVRTLAKQDCAVGFILPDIQKGQFFKGIVKDGVLPRKTFSMGHAQEKRYYLEARKIV